VKTAVCRAVTVVVIMAVGLLAGCSSGAAISTTTTSTSPPTTLTHLSALAILARRGIFLPSGCHPAPWIPARQKLSRTTAYDATCFYMEEMGRGRYETLLVREMSVAASNRLLGLGAPTSAGQVWVVIVRGPYRSVEQLVREHPPRHYSDTVWGGVFGPDSNEGVIAYTPGHVPESLQRALS
jgi:hypothetical protein